MDDPRGTAYHRDELTWLAFGMLGFYNYLLSGLGPLMPALREEHQPRLVFSRGSVLSHRGAESSEIELDAATFS